MNLKRYYEILEIEENASPAELRDAYEDLLQAWDPEAFSRNPGLKRKAEEKIAEIHEAYRKITRFSSGPEDPGFAGQSPSSKGGSAGHSGREEKRKTGAFETGPNDLPFHPWRRFSARMVDYFVFFWLLQVAGVFEIPFTGHVPSFFLPVIVTFIWIFFEALSLHFFCTTPGKWIFSIGVLNPSLVKPAYRGACLRGLSVWCNGLGTGFFLIAPVTLAVSYVRLRRLRIAPWDRTGRFHIIHGKVESRRLLKAALSAATVLFLAFQFERVGMVSSQEGVSLKNKAYENRGADDVTNRSAASMSETKDRNLLPATTERTPLTRANHLLLTGRYGEAVKAYQSIIKAAPNLAEARYGLGVSYAKKRDYSAAKEELQEAVKLAPRYAEAHHILGLIYVNTGNRDAALGQYQVLMHLDQELAKELNRYILNMKNSVKDRPGASQ